MKSVEYKAKNYPTFLSWKGREKKIGLEMSFKCSRWIPLIHEWVTHLFGVSWNMWHLQERGIFGVLEPKQKKTRGKFHRDACWRLTEAERKKHVERIYKIIDVNLWLLWGSFSCFPPFLDLHRICDEWKHCVENWVLLR